MEAEEEKREIFGASGADVADGVGEAWAAIGEVTRESVVGDDNDADVDDAIYNGVAKVADVSKGWACRTDHPRDA